MKIGDQGADVTGLGLPLRLGFEIPDIATDPFTPKGEVRLVAGVDGTPLGNLYLFVGEEKLSHRRVQGEAMDSLPCGVDEHGG